MDGKSILKDETVTYEELERQALQLSPLEKIKLIERLASALKYDVPQTKSSVPIPVRTSRGIAAHLGTAPSAEEIDQARREMYGNQDDENI